MTEETKGLVARLRHLIELCERRGSNSPLIMDFMALGTEAADLIDRLVLTSNEVKAGKVGSDAAPDDVERVARAMMIEMMRDDGKNKALVEEYMATPEADKVRSLARAAITAMGQPS